MRGRSWPLLLTAAALAFAPAARADDVETADRAVDEALAGGSYSFCSEPKKPLLEEQHALCALADEVPDCEGFSAACRAPLEAQPPKEAASTERWLAALAPLARILLYLLVLAIVVAIAVPVVVAILRARRSRRVADAAPARGAQAVVVPASTAEVEVVNDAETALRHADEHRRRGQYDRALALYLAATLTALERRGAVRIAKHRTNGEYVRSCTDEAARPPLREIVREVDRVQFGHVAPTAESVDRVATRASSVVRRTATMTLLALAVLSCSGGRHGPKNDDPAGDELPLEVLHRNGIDVEPLEHSLASLPSGAEAEKDPARAEVLLMDVDRVALTDVETRSHLVDWVEDGGALVLFGDPSRWPKELGAEIAPAALSRDVVLDPVLRIPRIEDAYDDDGEDEDQDDPPPVSPPAIHGRVARARAVTLAGSTPLGSIGDKSYVVAKRIGEGLLIGVANDDLFTNVGILPKHNAAILVEIVRTASTHARTLHASTRSGGAGADVRIRHARREDAIPPPSTPFAALLAAGLGKGAWHALVAAAILFLAYGIRQARPRGRKPVSRRAFAEHVEATGAFFERARAYPHALAAYGRFVEMRLRERLPRGADPVQFLAARASADPERVALVYRRALDAKGDDAVRGDELSTLKELRALLVKALEAS